MIAVVEIPAETFLSYDYALTESTGENCQCEPGCKNQLGRRRLNKRRKTKEGNDAKLLFIKSSL